MYRLFLLAATFVGATQVFAAESASVTLVRHFTLKSCPQAGACTTPNLRTSSDEAVVVKLEPFHKGDAKGVDGWDRAQTTEAGIPVKSEIHIIRHEGETEFPYFVYLMIRSGHRHGVIKTMHVRNLTDLKTVTLSDTPYVLKEGTFQAELHADIKPTISR